MIPYPDKPATQLPIVPSHVLMKHAVFYEFDNRFRACARLMQALWRTRQRLPIGTAMSCGRKRRLGSMISAAAANEGRNFLTPRIAEIARLETAFQEPGALIDRTRLYGNLLSSMPMCFNVFAPLREDLDLAARILRALIPDIDLAVVRHVWFEHSPNRQDESLTGDRTAFDVAFVYERSDGKRGLIGVETKFSESGTEPAPPELNRRYEVLAPASGLYKEPMHAALRVNPFQQLFREHLLARAAVMRGDYAESYFVQVAPRLNHLIQNSASLYAGFLKPKGPTPFINLHLEQVVEAFGWAGEHEHSLALHQRYLDWESVNQAVRDALKAKTAEWPAGGLEKAKPASGTAKAA